jgi:glyoxylase-like metal-dependent hydrolase (beta-lactamase superfamily II)
MGIEIPFVRDIKFEYGNSMQVSPLIRRAIANNPSAFTYTGTGTYIVGHGEVAVIDPGPRDERHLAALLRAIKGETVSHILITHTHSDHSPLARELKAETGALTYGFGPHGGNSQYEVKVEEDGDREFMPDRRVMHGDVLRGKDWTIECVFTPGHTSNHVCYALKEEKALFTGDHVMGWSTSVISPPDGNMRDYMASLRLLLERDDEIFWPTHGPAIRDPKPFLRAFIAHREDRERQILEQIGKGNGRIAGMVSVLYASVDKRLYPAAERSVLAHIEHLIELGRIKTDGTPSINSIYRPGV